MLRGYLLLGLVKKSTEHETNLKRSYLRGAGGCSGAVFAALEHFSQQVTRAKRVGIFARLKKMAIVAKSLPGLQVDFWDEDQRG